MKLLTGKTKEDFFNWFVLKNEHISLSDRFYEEFIEMPLAMQYGVLVDFFDSKGIFCEDRRYTDDFFAWVVKYPNFKGIQDRFDSKVKNRIQARTEAIKKANELYNEIHENNR